MKKTANLKRGRKHGSYDVIPACVRMRKGPSLELWNSTINILRVLLLTQNIKFTASWVRRVYSEVVLPVLHMLSILLLRSKTAPVSQLLGSFVFTTMSSTWSKSAKAQQKLFICFIFILFFFCSCFCDGSQVRDCASNWNSSDDFLLWTDLPNTLSVAALRTTNYRWNIALLFHLMSNISCYTQESVELI